MPPSPARRAERTRTILRWVLAAAYLVAGIAHIAIPRPFLGITPAWVPYPAQVILFTGVCELAGALALLTPRLRWWAGVLLAAYAVCVYPANVKHAIDQVLVAGNLRSLWYHVPRLAAQPVIVWWALFAGCVIDWPLARRRAGA
ncbi:DoxX family protein [Sphingomonas hylomeconis]|uniref:DoxX family protein n=1 Tax=Sphingomonas hylomeconis TaxID=1395958 RepID=A0ABV7T071_9SPHN|nr:DoxX family protein [Sphingomonas hylomeconis]